MNQDIPETDEDCLRYYCVEWQKYRWSSKVLDGICRYWNEQSLRKCATSKTMEQITLQVWREHVFKDLNEKISNAALKILDKDREGETVNSSGIQDVIQSYIELGQLNNDDEFDEFAYLMVSNSSYVVFC